MKNVLISIFLFTGLLSCTRFSSTENKIAEALVVIGDSATSDSQFDNSVEALNAIAEQKLNERPYPLDSLKKIYSAIADASLNRPPNWIPGTAWTEWVQDPSGVMEAVGRLDKLYPLVEKALGLNPHYNLSLATTLCKYERIHGKIQRCAFAVKALRNKISKSESLSLTLVHSLALLETGNHKAAMGKLSGILNDSSLEAKDIKPWANLLAAYVQMTIPNLANAKIYLDDHLRLLETINVSNLSPITKYFSKVTEITYLRETGALDKARIKALDALEAMTSEIQGTPMVKVWLAMELIAIAAQQRNSKELAMHFELLKSTVAELPDYSYTLDYIPAFDAALKGTYQPSMLNSVRDVIGNGNPPLKRTEFILGQLTGKK